MKKRLIVLILLTVSVLFSGCVSDDYILKEDAFDYVMSEYSLTSFMEYYEGREDEILDYLLFSERALDQSDYFQDNLDFESALAMTGYTDEDVFDYVYMYWGIDGGVEELEKAKVRYDEWKKRIIEEYGEGFFE